MSEDLTPKAMAAARAVERMTVDPPETLLPSVLLETGIADGWAVVAGPVGEVAVVFNDTGVTACVPIDHAVGLAEEYEAARGRRIIAVDTLPRRLARRVEKALASGKLGDLPVDLSGLSEFQQAVLRKTAEIPTGEVRPYSWIAREIGKPGALRAVGTALGRNPIPVLIPCHRVVKSDGTVGNYAYGPELKHSLLQAEGVDVDELEDLASQGRVITGTDTTMIYCFPTCRHARRVTEPHRQWFRSAREAAEKGYRACKVCRPEQIAA